MIRNSKEHWYLISEYTENDVFYNDLEDYLKGLNNDSVQTV